MSENQVEHSLFGKFLGFCKPTQTAIELDDNIIPSTTQIGNSIAVSNVIHGVLKKVHNNTKVALHNHFKVARQCVVTNHKHNRSC